jgi:hypothetical protein
MHISNVMMDINDAQNPCEPIINLTFTIMKKLATKAALLLATITIIIACDKQEQGLLHEQKKVDLTALNNYTPALVVNNKGKFFESIDTICSKYIKYTSKVDTFGVDPETWSHQLGYFYTLVLSWGETGFFARLPEQGTWFSNWNTPPFVEARNPTVYLPQFTQQTIELSRECYVFGFELSANKSVDNNKPVTIRVSYAIGDKPGDVIGYVENTVSSPGGARLFAVESEIPFKRVIIDYSPNTENTGQVAMAKFRYVKDKEIFDAHK